MTGCTTPSPRPLRDNEAAELEFVKLIEDWQEEWQLEDYEVMDILKRRVHYCYLKEVAKQQGHPNPHQ